MAQNVPALAALFWLFSGPVLIAQSGTTKQQSLDEWRALTAPLAPVPRVFVKGDHVPFLLPGG